MATHGECACRQGIRRQGPTRACLGEHFLALKEHSTRREPFTFPSPESEYDRIEPGRHAIPVGIRIRRANYHIKIRMEGLQGPRVVNVLEMPVLDRHMAVIDHLARKTDDYPGLVRIPAGCNMPANDQRTGLLGASSEGNVEGNRRGSFGNDGYGEVRAGESQSSSARPAGLRH